MRAGTDLIRSVRCPSSGCAARKDQSISDNGESDLGGFYCAAVLFVDGGVQQIGEHSERRRHALMRKG